METYIECPAKYKYRSDRTAVKAKLANTEPVQFGIFFHSLMQHANEFRITSGEYPGPAWFEYRLNEQLKDKTPARARAWKKEIMNFYSLYLMKVDHMTSPIMVESFFHIVSPKGLHIAGAFDFTTPSGLCDYKTSYKPIEVKPTHQTNIYALAFSLIAGRWPSIDIWNFVRMTSSVVCSPIIYDEKNVSETIDKFEDIHDNIEAGLFEATPGPRCPTCIYRNVCEPGQQHISKLESEPQNNATVYATGPAAELPDWVSSITPGVPVNGQPGAG